MARTKRPRRHETDEERRSRHLNEIIHGEDGYCLITDWEYQDDEEMVVAAMPSGASMVLESASERLRDKEAVVKKAVAEDPWALEYASERLRHSKEFILSVARDCQLLLHSSNVVPEHFRNDYDVVLAAVSNHGYLLEGASQVLKANREIVLAAVRNDGSALKYAADELLDDEELLSVAVQQNACALRYASPKIRNNPKMWVTALCELPRDSGDDVRRFVWDAYCRPVLLRQQLVNLRDKIIQKWPKTYMEATGSPKCFARNHLNECMERTWLLNQIVEKQKLAPDIQQAIFDWSLQEDIALAQELLSVADCLELLAEKLYRGLSWQDCLRSIQA